MFGVSRGSERFRNNEQLRKHVKILDSYSTDEILEVASANDNSVSLLHDAIMAVSIGGNSTCTRIARSVVQLVFIRLQNDTPIFFSFSFSFRFHRVYNPIHIIVCNATPT